MGGGTEILVLAGVFVLAYGLSLIPGLENLRLYSIYFALGNLLYGVKKSGVLSQKLEHVLAALAVLAFVLCIVLYFANTPSLVKWVSFKVMGIAGSITFALIALLCEKPGKISTFLNWTGKKTLPIYAIHWCLLFSMDIPELWRIELPFYLVAVFGSALWLLICLALIVLIQRNKTARMLLLGEQKMEGHKNV